MIPPKIINEKPDQTAHSSKGLYAVFWSPQHTMLCWGQNWAVKTQLRKNKPKSQWFGIKGSLSLWTDWYSLFSHESPKMLTWMLGKPIMTFGVVLNWNSLSCFDGVTQCSVCVSSATRKTVLRTVFFFISLDWKNNIHSIRAVVLCNQIRQSDELQLLKVAAQFSHAWTPLLGPHSTEVCLYHAFTVSASL